MHRRRSSVNFRGYDIFSRKMCMKNYQNTRMFMIFGRKMPEFYIIIARKIFSPIFFLGGGTSPLPLRLWPYIFSCFVFVSINPWLMSGHRSNIAITQYRHYTHYAICYISVWRSIRRKNTLSRDTDFRTRRKFVGPGPITCEDLSLFSKANAPSSMCYFLTAKRGNETRGI